MSNTRTRLRCPQRRRGARLIDEPRDDRLDVRELAVEHLDRALVPEHEVLPQVDRAHAAGPELGDDLDGPDLLADHGSVSPGSPIETTPRPIRAG
jgi:hypothetical protein